MSALPVDNNQTERTLRGVVGRKDHYGSKSRRGTEVAALFYSLVESAKLAGVEPHAYLRAPALAPLRAEQVPLPPSRASTSPSRMRSARSPLWDVAEPFIDALPENASDRARRDAVEKGVLVVTDRGRAC